MVEQGKLQPILASGTNGKNPPLYKRYRLLSPKTKPVFNAENYASQFPVYFDSSYYLSHRVQFEKDLWGIEKLIDFLKNDPDLTTSDMKAPLVKTQRALFTNFLCFFRCHAQIPEWIHQLFNPSDIRGFSQVNGSLKTP